jgi:hypothetical protein
MEKKELISKITEFSSDLMEKHFPKGECKERSNALAFNAEMIIYISDLFEQELDKAREEVIKEIIKKYGDYTDAPIAEEIQYTTLEEALEEMLSKLKDNK